MTKESNGIDVIFPDNKCIHELFENQVEITPNATAVVFEGKSLTYRELNNKANQLAHYLQELGIRPEMLVGIFVERSLDMVVGMLAILKAGGAYVPFDITCPAERLAYMLEDAQVTVLITHTSSALRLPDCFAHVVYVDDAEALRQKNTNNPISLTTADDSAYVIYTSGSTGRPKGVQISHRSLLNLVFWHQHAFKVTEACRATQVASPAFDATGWELWPYLTIGASVYLPDEETRISPVLLRNWLIQNDITITFLPTVLAESVIALEWPEKTALRFLLTGADTLHHYPPANLPFALINNYGPTEATVVATSGQILPNAHPDMPPSIGRPIANTHIYILDEDLQPVPTSTPGELYIGGVGLAKGYLNRPDLTAERFIPHPFVDDPHACLYKTGDLARYLPDGQIAFLGRADYQIKLRGYRIEPGEIVTLLNEHQTVQTSYVMAREDISEEKQLVAYVVPSAEEQITLSSLREPLTARLPDYMIPSVFVQLECLPLTANGKVNRAALPLPDATNRVRDMDMTSPPPCTPIEEQLIHIIAPLLGLEQIGVDDNFFMLGGHSLLGTQIIARVGDTFGVALTLRSLFGSPTVRELADEIEQLIFAQLESMSDEEVERLLQQGVIL